MHKINVREISSREPDYKSFISNFAWCSVDIIKKTFTTTTSAYLTKHFKSPFPALNVQRRQKSVAIDTVYVDVPTIDSGFTQAQIYCGMESHVCDVYGMKTDKQFINTFEDVIRQRETMDILISDIAQVETQRRAKDILRAYVIGNWQNETNQQHQNPVECKYQHIKSTTNQLLERSGSLTNT